MCSYLWYALVYVQGCICNLQVKKRTFSSKLRRIGRAGTGSGYADQLPQTLDRNPVVNARLNEVCSFANLLCLAPLHNDENGVIPKYKLGAASLARSLPCLHFESPLRNIACPTNQCTLSDNFW